VFEYTKNCSAPPYEDRALLPTSEKPTVSSENIYPSTGGRSMHGTKFGIVRNTFMSNLLM